MKAVFLITWRQWQRGGAKTWFTLFSALVCSTVLAAIQFGGASIASGFSLQEEYPLQMFVLGISQAVNVLIILFLVLFMRGIFLLSFSQRVKMLGQLAGIGATQRQLRQSMWFDALFLSIFSAPLGVVLALCGLSVTLWAMKPTIEFLSSVSMMQIHLTVTPLGVALALLCPTLSFFLCAATTLHKVSQLSPIESIREIHSLPSLPKHRSKRKLPILQLLATRSRQRKKGHFWLQTSGLVLCIGLIFLSQSFSQNLLASYQNAAPAYSYRVYLWVQGVDTQQLLNELTRQIQTVSADTVCSSEIIQSGYEKLITLDDKSFAAWYGASLPNDPQTLHCIFPTQNTTKYSVGDTIANNMGVNMVVSDICSNQLPAGVLESVLPYADFAERYNVFVTSQSAANAVWGSGSEQKREFQIFVETADGSQISASLQTALDKMGAKPFSYETQTGIQYIIQDSTPTSVNVLYRNSMFLLLKVFATGFECLVFIGGIAASIGSFLSELKLRQKEFLLLRSAGMTQNELKTMIGKEVSDRCLIGTAIGILFGIFCFLGINRIFFTGQVQPFVMFQKLSFSVLLCIIGVVVLKMILTLCTKKAISSESLVFFSE